MGLLLSSRRAAMTLSRRAALAASVSTLLALGSVLGSATPVVACSCAGFQSMKDYANAESAVFTGEAGPRVERGVPVEVDQWFWGDGAAPLIWLAASSFGDEAGCGTTPPTPGTRWIWVTWRPENEGDFGTGLCSPAAMLDTPEGAKMLDDAMATFGGETIGNPTAEPTPEPPQAPTETPADGANVAAIVAGGVILASLGLFGGLILISRRQRPTQS